MTSSIEIKSETVSDLPQAPPIISPAPGQLSAFFANEDFTIFWRSSTLSFVKGRRYVVEMALKEAISATDRAVIWGA